MVNGVPGVWLRMQILGWGVPGADVAAVDAQDVLPQSEGEVEDEEQELHADRESVGRGQQRGGANERRSRRSMA